MDIPWKLPLGFRVLNRVASACGAERLVRFDPDFLKRTACGHSGLSDFGDPWFEAGFRALVESLEADAGLSLLGRIGLQGMVRTLLINRLLFRAERISCTGSSGPIPPPLVILGLPRSGTTFLHRLLSVDPAHRALPMWRLQRPFPPRSRPDRRIRETDQVLRWYRRLSPQLDRKHFIRPESPEECIWLLNSTFVSHGLWVAAPVYGYLGWLSCCDRRPAYREYASLLARLQVEDSERTLVLKAPSHSGSLAELLEALPGARIVQTHRDPVQVLPSLNSLICSVHCGVVKRVDPQRTGQANLRMLRHELSRSRDARNRIGGRVLDVEYVDLCGDPVGTVRSVYRDLGLLWPKEYEGVLSTYLKEHPQHRHGRHTYRNDAFGIAEDEIRGVFREYRNARGYTAADPATTPDPPPAKGFRR